MSLVQFTSLVLIILDIKEEKSEGGRSEKVVELSKAKSNTEVLTAVVLAPSTPKVRTWPKGICQRSLDEQFIQLIISDEIFVPISNAVYCAKTVAGSQPPR